MPPLSKEIRPISHVLEFGAIDQESTMLPLLLASSSAYRRELLARLRLPFAGQAPI
jgi:hypothetical protein